MCLDKEFVFFAVKWGKIMNIIVVGCGKVGLTPGRSIKQRRAWYYHCGPGWEGSSPCGGFPGYYGNPWKRCHASDAKGSRSAECGCFNCGNQPGWSQYALLLFAKKEGNCRTIARIRDPQYTTEISYLRDELNLAMVINPDMAAAKEIERLLRFPSAMKVDSFSRGKLDLIRVKVPKESQLIGIPLHTFQRIRA